jgi:twitching motility protein PilU
MDYAIAFSETGHLCLATLHANSANQALDRIINFFPSDRRDQLLMDLSLNLKEVISQRLVPMIGGGRIPAVEIMIGTPFVQDLIHRGAVHDIKPVMAKSRDLGMQTFDQSLFDLVAMGKIEPTMALRYADSSNDLRLMIKNLDLPGIDGFDKSKDLSLL